MLGFSALCELPLCDVPAAEVPAVVVPSIPATAPTRRGRGGFTRRLPKRTIAPEAVPEVVCGGATGQGQGSEGAGLLELVAAGNTGQAAQSEAAGVADHELAEFAELLFMMSLDDDLWRQAA